MTAPRDERRSPRPGAPNHCTAFVGPAIPAPRRFRASIYRFGQKFGAGVVPKWNSILNEQLTPMSAASGVMKSPLSREYSMQVALFKQL